MELHRDIKGIMWMVSSCLCASLLAASARHVSLDLNPYFVCGMQGFFAFIIICSWFLITERKFPKTEKSKIYLLRCGVGVTSILAMIVAITMIPLSNVMAINFSAPLFTVLISVLFIKERVKPHRIIALIIGFAGVMIVLRPGSDAFQWGAIIMLLSAFFRAFVNITVMTLTKFDETKVIQFFTGLFMAIFFLPLIIFWWEAPTTQHILWLIFAGLCTVFFQFSLAKSFSHSKLTTVMPFDFSGLIFASLIGFFAFSEIPDIWVFVGGGVILASSVYALMREVNRG